jgi:hypothetical protein
MVASDAGSVQGGPTTWSSSKKVPKVLHFLCSLMF